jgi:uncharacterized protein (DUF2252 family)
MKTKNPAVGLPIQLEHRSRAEAYAAGKAIRDRCPRKSHATWRTPAGRPDPVQLVLDAEKGRLPSLLPLRHGRMARSPFAFYRGAALTMATDLAVTPATGVHLQCCGDAHLANFGGFATPERRVIFSINDLDETLPAPWEWDLKRLAGSFAIASLDNGLSDRTARDMASACVRAYRESMAEFSSLRTLELWYRSLVADELVEAIPDAALRRDYLMRLQKEEAISIVNDIFPKLVEEKGRSAAIRDQHPTIFHQPRQKPGQVKADILAALKNYRATLPASYQALLERFRLRDAAIKVVGVGSVGTRCWVLLLMAGDGDPLFLQVKEARASVLEAFAGPSRLANHGQRVVNGYRLMQPASDIFLGWTQSAGHDYYIRQLRDIKITIRVETLGREEMNIYAQWCGRALALSHARSGRSALLSGYMGKSDALDRAIAAFSMTYAERNEKDHAAFVRAIRRGKVRAEFEKSP